MDHSSNLYGIYCDCDSGVRGRNFTPSLFERVMLTELQLSVSCAYFTWLIGRINCQHVPCGPGMQLPTDPNHSHGLKSLSFLWQGTHGTKSSHNLTTQYSRTSEPRFYVSVISRVCVQNTRVTSSHFAVRIVKG